MLLANLDFAHFASDRHDIFHASSKDDHLSSAGNCSLQNLGYTVYIGSEGCDDEPSACFFHRIENFRCHLFLGNGEILHTGIGGIAQQQIDTDLSHIRHDLIIGIGADRGQVKFEIAGMNDASVRRVDQNSQRIGNGVSRIEEAACEMLHLNRAAIIDFNDFHTAQHSALLQLFVDQCHCKGRGIDCLNIHAF